MVKKQYFEAFLGATQQTTRAIARGLSLRWKEGHLGLAYFVLCVPFTIKVIEHNNIL